MSDTITLYHGTNHEKDVVIGPTADGDTRASIRAIMNAANGAVLSEAALNLLLEMLLLCNRKVQDFGYVF